jgi:hypothetical protein
MIRHHHCCRAEPFAHGFEMPAFSQNQSPSGAQEYRLAQAAAGGESSEADENNPQAEDRQVSQKIDKARSAGKDVSSAEQHQKQGEQAMNSGHNKPAPSSF